MKKYFTLIVFLLLVCIWSMFFSTIKFYLWSSLTAHSITLEQIAGYLSLGSVLAYLIGGSLAISFRKKTILFYISLLVGILLLIRKIFGYSNMIFFSILVCGFGFFYGLWSVIKNILIGIEIKKTNLSDNVVNALVTIGFLISIISGGIIGGKLFENYSINGVYIIILLMFFSLLGSMLLDSQGQSIFTLFKNSLKKTFYSKKQLFIQDITNYFKNIKLVWKNYKMIIVVTSFMWAISTIFSQRCIEFVTEHFHKTTSQAAYLLLYSSIGIILGNVLTMFMKKNRWLYFNIFNIGFIFVLIAFMLWSSSYQMIIWLSILGGFFFGAGVNLIEAYYFHSIADANLKEYGSSTFSLILSIIIFIMMQISAYSFNYISFNFVFYVMLVILMGISILVYYNKEFKC